MLIATLLAAGGLLFAFDHATIAGKLVLSRDNRTPGSSKFSGRTGNLSVCLKSTHDSLGRQYLMCIAPDARK